MRLRVFCAGASGVVGRCKASSRLDRRSSGWGSCRGWSGLSWNDKRRGLTVVRCRVTLGGVVPGGVARVDGEAGFAGVTLVGGDDGEGASFVTLGCSSGMW